MPARWGRGRDVVVLPSVVLVPFLGGPFSGDIRPGVSDVRRGDGLAVGPHVYILGCVCVQRTCLTCPCRCWIVLGWLHFLRSEEHTSELQSLTNLVCRLLLA